MLNEDEIDRRYLLRKYEDTKKIIIVTDLHLGFEIEWSNQGLDVKLPKWSFEIIDLLKRDIELTKSHILIILGDLEHSFTHFKDKKENIWTLNNWMTEKILNYFLDKIYTINDLEIVVLRGNQDTLLFKLLPKDIVMYPAKGASLFSGKLGIFHGNVLPSEDVVFSSEIILGHVHPAIELIDELNIRHKLHVFAKLKLTREELLKAFNFSFDLEEIGLIEKIQITILPAYNSFMEGFILNSNRRKYRRLQRIITHPDLRVQMTNGIELGFLKDL